MTDIVQRLKQWGECHLGATDVAETAAYEIEDLRYQLAFEEASRINAFMELEKQDAEIEKMRLALNDIHSVCQSYGSFGHVYGPLAQIKYIVREVLNEQRHS